MDQVLLSYGKHSRELRYVVPFKPPRPPPLACTSQLSTSRPLIYRYYPVIFLLFGIPALTFFTDDCYNEAFLTWA